MKLIVNPHRVEIIKTPVNEREIDISKCEFEFADEITNEYVKEAYFTFKGTTYKQIITNNECAFPSEVLAEKGQVEIGVVAYIVENENELKRYNPSPAYFDTWQGSLKDNYENSEPITPTDKEQIESAIAGLQSDVSDLEANKQDTLVSGENIKTINSKSLLGSGDIDLNDTYYTEEEVDTLLEDKANKDSLSEVAFSGSYNDLEDKPSIPSKTSDLNNDSGYITNEVNDLINYTLKTQTGSRIDLEINSSTYVMVAKLYDKDNNLISTSSNIDLPLETMVIGASYDSETKEIILILKNGTTVRFSVADLVSGLQTEITSENMLSADLVDDTNATHKFTSSGEKSTWNGKYDKPSGGIPKTDLASDVQTSLGKADTALQEHQDISGKEDKTNKVTSISSLSTDTQYPSAKCVYDSQTEQDTNINALNSLVEQLPRVTGTGTDLELENTLDYKFMKNDLKGNSSQEETKGYQLANITNYSDTVKGVNVSCSNNVTTMNGTVNEVGTLMGSSSNTGRLYMATLPAGDYTFNFKVVSGSVSYSSGQCAVYLRNESSQSIKNLNISNATTSSVATFSLSEETNIYFQFYVNATNWVFNNYKFQLMIASGTYTASTMPAFEKFTGGMPAPNPSYPYPVKVVTGENSLIIQNKNLFDKNSMTSKNGFTKDADGNETSMGGFSYTTSYTKVKPNTVYTLSGNLVNSNGTVRIYYYNENKNWISRSDGFGVNVNVCTFTTPVNCQYIQFQYINVAFDINTIQLEKGSNATPYVAHQEQNYQLSLGNMEFCKIGDYQDYIYKNGENWYKKQFLGKAVFDGSIDEDWRRETLSNNRINYYIVVSDAKGGSDVPLLNSIGIYTGNLNGNHYTRISSGTNPILNYICNEMSSLENFRTMLNTTNLVLYFPLAEPTDIQITDTTLINQLNNIYNNAYSYNGTTNVTTTYADGNEQFILDFEALMDLNSLITRIETIESEI